MTGESDRGWQCNMPVLRRYHSCRHRHVCFTVEGTGMSLFCITYCVHWAGNMAYAEMHVFHFETGCIQNTVSQFLQTALQAYSTPNSTVSPASSCQASVNLHVSCCLGWQDLFCLLRWLTICNVVLQNKAEQLHSREAVFGDPKITQKEADRDAHFLRQVFNISLTQKEKKRKVYAFQRS